MPVCGRSRWRRHHPDLLYSKEYGREIQFPSICLGRLCDVCILVDARSALAKIRSSWLSMRSRPARHPGGLCRVNRQYRPARWCQGASHQPRPSSGAPTAQVVRHRTRSRAMHNGGMWERLAKNPTWLRVFVTRRPKYPCRSCTEGVVHARDGRRQPPAHPLQRGSRGRKVVLRSDFPGQMYEAKFPGPSCLSRVAYNFGNLQQFRSRVDNCTFPSPFPCRQRKTFRVPDGMPLTVAVTEFVAALRAGSAPIASLRISINFVRLLDACVSLIGRC